MALKIALIFAICIAQGFAMAPIQRGPGKESAEEMPHEFEAVHEMDEDREIVSMAAYANGIDPHVIIACFRDQRRNYMGVVKRIEGMTRRASKKMAEELGQNYEKYRKRAEVPLRTIAITMETLPFKTWEHIKKNEFGKALEVMKKSRRFVQENSKILSNIMVDMAQEFPESAKKAEEMARVIRTAAREGCRAIGEAFRKCVEERAPKKPIEDEDNEIDEDSE